VAKCIRLISFLYSLYVSLALRMENEPDMLFPLPSDGYWGRRCSELADDDPWTPVLARSSFLTVRPSSKKKQLKEGMR